MRKVLARNLPLSFSASLERMPDGQLEADKFFSLFFYNSGPFILK